ncbi:hypothetical protein D3C75_738640 [compost metagenome]
MLDWWLPSRLEKLVAKFSPDPCPWATSSRSSRRLLLRSKIHRRRWVEGSEKSMTARRSAGCEPLLMAHCMAAKAWRRTSRLRVGAALARLSIKAGVRGVLARSEDEKAARPAASQSERISLVMNKVSSVVLTERTTTDTRHSLCAGFTLCLSATPCR